MNISVTDKDVYHRFPHLVFTCTPSHKGGKSLTDFPVVVAVQVLTAHHYPHLTHTQTV